MQNSISPARPQLLWIILLLSLLAPPRGYSSTPPSSGWTVLVLREFVGTFSSLRIDSTGGIEFAQFEMGRLVKHQTLPAPPPSLSTVFSELESEVSSFLEDSATTPSDPDASSSVQATWAIYLVEWSPSSAKVYTVPAAAGRFPSTINLLMNEVEQSVESGRLEEGVIVTIPPSYFFDNPFPTAPITDEITLQLLGATAKLLDADSQSSLPVDLSTLEEITATEAGGLLFTIRRLAP